MSALDGIHEYLAWHGYHETDLHTHNAVACLPRCRKCAALAALSTAEEAIEALRRIAHYPWDVNAESEHELRAVKEIATEALRRLDGDTTSRRGENP